jgi:hypothetical protein
MRKRFARRRRARQGGILLVAVVAIAAVAYFISQEPEPTPRADPSSLQGLNEGEPPWPPELENLRQRLLAIDLPPQEAEGQGLHSDQHLDIFVHGQPVEVPAQIGIPPGFDQESPGASETDFISILHTHDATGLVHVEAPETHAYTLGEFFDVWGVRLTDDCLGGLCEKKDDQIRVYVNGELQDGPPGDVEFSLQALSQEIVLTYGTKAELPNPIPSQPPG